MVTEEKTGSEPDVAGQRMTFFTIITSKILNRML